MADSTTGYVQPARPVTPTPPAPATSTTYGPSFSYGPSDINAGLVARGVPPDHARILTATTGAESNFGKSQVGALNPNGTRDYGLGQINSKAWPQLNPPSLVHAPLNQQLDAIAYVYHHQGLDAWVTYKNGAYKKYLNQVDSTTPTATGSGATSSAPAPAPVPTTPSPPTTVGGLLGTLNTPDDSGKSPMSNLSSMAGGGGQAPQVPPPNIQGQMAAGYGNIRQAQIAQQAAAQMVALQQRAAQPLSWTSQTPGSMAGARSSPQVQTIMGGQQIPMPGTTLTSMGNFYGG